MVWEDHRVQGSGVTREGNWGVLKRQERLRRHEGGRIVPEQVGSISVCRAVGKSLDLFRCANTQKHPF